MNLLAQTVHANSSYTCREMIWDTTFAKMYEYKPEEALTVLDLDKINEVVTTQSTTEPLIK